MVETINLCCAHFEAQTYVVPDEKYQLLKVPASREGNKSFFPIDSNALV